jgi:hypothetical protein
VARSRQKRRKTMKEGYLTQNTWINFANLSTFGVNTIYKPTNYCVFHTPWMLMIDSLEKLLLLCATKARQGLAYSSLHIEIAAYRLLPSTRNKHVLDCNNSYTPYCNKRGLCCTTRNSDKSEKNVNLSYKFCIFFAKGILYLNWSNTTAWFVQGGCQRGKEVSHWLDKT